MLPERIGRYDIHAELGRGATSIVYRGVDPATGRTVAIKTLQRTPGGDGDGAEEADAILLRFRNEARTVGRLRHPGIVAVDEFGEDGLHSWIAMEHVEGGSLDELLLRSPLPGAQRAVEILDELLDALGCVHQHGICHRDVKPANIMLTPSGRVKLMDFGVARLRDLGLTRVSSLIGTPAFMAPEQFTGGALDHRADLFACGVLLFLLLAGRRPFSGAPAAVMHQILNEPAPLLSEASGGLAGRAWDGVVARALSKRADARFASAQHMREALHAAAAQAAEATLATVVKTLVQSADPAVPAEPRTAAPGAPWAAPHWPSHDADSMASLVMSPARRESRRVDALSLYVAEADGPAFDFDELGPPGVVPGDSELQPTDRLAAQQVLARHLGPVAGALVRRAAGRAGGSRVAFTTHLLADVPEARREAVRSELEALLASPQAAGAGR